MTDIDIPTAVTQHERETLELLAKDKAVVEIGSLLGYSTVALARVAEYVVAIDPHEGYPRDNPRPTYDTFISNLRRYNVRDKVVVIPETFQKARMALAASSFDLAFIDATGEYNLTFELLWGIRAFLHEYATICVHDCGHPEWPGAVEAVKDFTRDLGADYALVDRLAVISL